MFRRIVKPTFIGTEQYCAAGKGKSILKTSVQVNILARKAGRKRQGRHTHRMEKIELEKRCWRRNHFLRKVVLQHEVMKTRPHIIVYFAKLLLSSFSWTTHT